ncbi:MAG: Na+/H+ antiporter subunit B [Chloroflexi bacterium AL-W]|nr:Na+/H+ antiporter subunit B [Chloroflexi bacterium AL-N1]NOK69648.1 Na+/H+ antiporter subunit B [Chloroflexi bacterium AL-N10]NOK72195.1 Na+/H+ antiporter subunit B [Chloroflexi bacterium AL-N5]NOK85024.1 Na+/H+ antiporter subunit B [Chloroflexi bacterium AL-W]NOK91777.1 Na+/H+ antiporter subunit B [Chloroflexi bacterium AL-N15]
MASLILSVATRYLLPLLLLFSLVLLLRGHYFPGGGFVGGMVASAAFALYALSNGTQVARQALRVSPINLIGFGLSTALVSGIVALFLGLPLMTGLWSEQEIPVLGAAGTPLLFDVGVYFTVIGVTLLIIFTLTEE